MISSEKQRQRFVGGRARWCIAGMLVMFVSCFTLPGCGGPSKGELAKQDEQGKQTNEAAMNRMIQEQGKAGGTGGAGGK